jgi:hypothetical protein
MQSITSKAQLKFAIQQLEDKRALQSQLLNEEFHVFADSLKPVNLLKSTLNDVITTPNLGGSILSSLVGLITGFFSTRLLVGSSRTVIKNLVGSILQVGVTNLIANNSDSLKSMGHRIIQGIFNKKESTDPEQNL